MSEIYHQILSGRLESGATFHKPVQNLPERVTMNNPAMDVMTDFKVVTAYTIFPLESIDDAHQKMVHRGVRMLLVVDAKNNLLGLVTSTDLMGEKPMQVIQNTGCKHAEVLVRDIMTPSDRLEVVCMVDLAGARVGDVLATLKATGRQHALVVDRPQAGQAQKVRGILSMTQLTRQLGVTLETPEIARTFSEIETQLAN